jgi:ADP-ribosylation factor GTPase-activating protein 1
MDAFKQNEILRMQHGGNKAWQDFYNANIGSENGGKSFDDSGIKERYESDAGDEWKETLSAKVDEKDFDREAWKREREAYKAKAAAKASSRSQTPVGAGPRRAAGATGISSSSNPASRSESPLPPSQKERNEAYFSNLGATNASRPENLPPSQGGRYAGFGSSPPPPASSSSSSMDPSQPAPNQRNIPSPAEFQSDPVAALSKSFGWFTTSITRTAKTVNEGYIQPTAKNIAASDLAAQARAAALQAGTGIQSSAKSASESFNRFVDGQDQSSTRSSTAAGSAGAGRAEPERKDFWDTFGAPTATASGTGPEATNPKPSSIGTAAMKKGAGPGNCSGSASNGPVTGGGAAAAAAAAPPSSSSSGGKAKEDGWDDW